jgi:hypothetical protein
MNQMGMSGKIRFSLKHEIRQQTVLPTCLALPFFNDEVVFAAFAI